MTVAPVALRPALSGSMPLTALTMIVLSKYHLLLIIAISICKCSFGYIFCGKFVHKVTNVWSKYWSRSGEKIEVNMAQPHFVKGYKLYIGKHTDDEAIAYFKTKEELERFIIDEKLKEQKKHYQFREHFLPDLSKPPRYYIMLRLTNGSHVEFECYEKDDLDRFIKRHQDNALGLDTIFIDREKEQQKSNQEFLGKAVMVIIGLIVLYFLFK